MRPTTAPGPSAIEGYRRGGGRYRGCRPVARAAFRRQTRPSPSPDDLRRVVVQLAVRARSHDPVVRVGRLRPDSDCVRSYPPACAPFRSPDRRRRSFRWLHGQRECRAPPDDNDDPLVGGGRRAPRSSSAWRRRAPPSRCRRQCRRPSTRPAREAVPRGGQVNVDDYLKWGRRALPRPRRGRLVLPASGYEAEEPAADGQAGFPAPAQWARRCRPTAPIATPGS
jgi:hypothetical protein